MLADHFSGAPRPLQIAGIDRVNCFLAQPHGDLFGLLQSDIAEITIARSLTAMFQVPIGGAMAHEYYLHVDWFVARLARFKEIVVELDFCLRLETFKVFRQGALAVFDDGLFF